MKIIHIISSLEMGGAQQVLFILVKALHKKGHQQAVIYMHDGPFKKQFDSLGIQLHQVHGAIAMFDPLCLVRLIRLLKKLKPDCVHTVLWAANWLGRIATRILSVPCVNSLHNNYDINGMLRIFLDKAISYKNSTIVAVSQEVKQSFVRAVSGTTKVVVIPNGIELPNLRKFSEKIALQKRLGLTPHDFVIGSVGRFHPVKRFSFLLQTFAVLAKKYNHLRLVLIGAGELENDLRAQAEALGITSSIRWVIGESAQKYYPIFDCFTLSSEKEGISIALLEAMSFGIPPVITNHVAQHSVIKNGENGYVANALDQRDYATKLCTLIDDKAAAIEIGRNAQRAVQELFDANGMIHAYSSIFLTASSGQEMVS